MIEKVAFFTFSPTISALEHYRVFGPLTQAGVQVLDGIKQGRVDPGVIRESDIVLFQRDFASHFDWYQVVVSLARELGKPVVMDMDDDLLALPPDHPDRITTYYAVGLPALLHAILNVDGVTVTTGPLKEAIQKLNPNVWILPNYLDEQLWHFRPHQPSLPEQPLTILYMGTATHRPDLNLVSKPLFQLAEVYGAALRFYFYGIEPPLGLEALTQVIHQPVQTYDYQAFASHMSHVQADLAIAPLCDNTFNRSKSAIKFFEYTAMGIPGIYADMPPYSQIIRDGYEGLLAQTPDQWFEKIQLLIRDPELRQRIVLTSQESVQAHWLMSRHASEWPQTYAQIKPSTRKPQVNRSNLLDSLGQIVAQQKEIRAKQDLINELNNLTATQSWQLGALEEQKAAADGEIRRLSQTLEETSTKLGALEEQKVAADGEIRRLSQTLEETSTKLGALEEQKVAADGEIRRLSQTLDETQREMVSYALSPSWKITRPLRKITKLLRGKK